MGKEYRDRIVDYCITADPDRVRLTALVRNQLTSGWVPLGGVATTGTGSTAVFYQAMVMYR